MTPLTLAALDAYRRIVTEANTQPVISVPLTPADALTLLDIAEDHARLMSSLTATNAKHNLAVVERDALRARLDDSVADGLDRVREVQAANDALRAQVATLTAENMGLAQQCDYEQAAQATLTEELVLLRKMEEEIKATNLYYADMPEVCHVLDRLDRYRQDQADARGEPCAVTKATTTNE